MEGFEPPTDQLEIVKLSTAPRGTRRNSAVEELIFFVRMFFFEFVLALWAHPAPAISLLFHPKCLKKNENKPRLRNFRLYTSRLQTFKKETNPSSTRRSSPAALTQGVPKRTKHVHKWRALARVYDVPFWYLPRVHKNKSMQHLISSLWSTGTAKFQVTWLLRIVQKGVSMWQCCAVDRWLMSMQNLNPFIAIFLSFFFTKIRGEGA